NFQQLAHGQAGKSGGVEGANIDLAVVDEIIGAAPVEGFVRVGNEEMGGMAAGRPGQVGAVGENLVQALAIVCGDVFDVGHVLVAPFNLEGADARINQGA